MGAKMWGGRDVYLYLPLHFAVNLKRSKKIMAFKKIMHMAIEVQRKIITYRLLGTVFLQSNLMIYIKSLKVRMLSDQEIPF